MFAEQQNKWASFYLIFFATNRLHCGYINPSYVLLSCLCMHSSKISRSSIIETIFKYYIDADAAAVAFAISSTATTNSTILPLLHHFLDF